MYHRRLKEELEESVKSYPVIAVLGPRQTGKTTIVKSTFPDWPYVLLEEIDVRQFALSDPKGFLKYYGKEGRLIIDEAQYAPELFSYIQGIVDEKDEPGMFILTGSQNYHLSEKITQTLAGRIRILTLLPPSIGELKQTVGLPDDYETLIFDGCYPRIQFKKLSARRWFQDYIATYIERDVRQMKNITDLHLFQKFLGHCAGRCGQLLNWSELARDTGITIKTAESWMSLLEASYLVFLLPPFFKNYGKRLVKSPKLYFHDTGIGCSLLGIQSPDQVENHYLRGALFESMIISDLLKRSYHRGFQPHFYFWRDQVGHEIDCLIDRGTIQLPVEIKSGRTLNLSYFEALKYWNRLTEGDPTQSFLIYGGGEHQVRSDGVVINWSNIDQIPF